MAGDWMKIELELPDKPEVHSIAMQLNLDPDAVVGKLIRVWQWFDKHTIDGNARGVTFALVDRISGVTGFGNAMMKTDWLNQQDDVLSMPKFDRHTSESAKTRALTAKRVAKSKQKSNAKGNAVGVSEALPKEEKRRDISNTDVLDIGEEKKTPKRAHQLPDDFAPNDWHRDFVMQNNLDLDSTFAQFCDYHRAHGSTMKDWPAAFRTWLRNAVTYRKKNGVTKEAYHEKMQRVADQLTGRTHAGITIDMDRRTLPKI